MLTVGRMTPVYILGFAPALRTWGELGAAPIRRQSSARTAGFQTGAPLPVWTLVGTAGGADPYGI